MRRGSRRPGENPPPRVESRIRDNPPPLMLTPSDIHVAAASFLGVMIAEVIVKPVAIRTGRYILRTLDDKIGVIPDWLSKH